MWQIGHRGFSDKYGDNNMESFKRAYECGFDMIELDIQLCKTGEIVVYHDTWIENNYIIDIPLTDLQTSHKVVLLEDVFEMFVHTQILLFLDIKGSELITDTLLDLINKWFSRTDIHRLYISGFNRKFVAGLNNPQYRFHIGLTTENGFTIEQLRMLCQEVKFVCFHWTALDKEAIDFLHEKGILVFSYTCKDDFILNHMLEYDIDGIVTNYFISDNESPKLRKKTSSLEFILNYQATMSPHNIEF